MALMRNASILFAATMAGNGANYFFQFVMGRTLSLEDYGSMNALLSLLTGITIPASAVMIVLARYASMYSALGNACAVSSLYRASLKAVALFAVAAALLLLASGPLIRPYLRIEAHSPFVLISLGLIFSFLYTVNMGTLQGLQKFNWLGLSIGVNGVLRLAIGASLVLAGMGLNGALAATIAPALILFILTIKPLSTCLEKAETAGHRHEGIIQYGVPVLAASAAFAFMINVDVVMAKHYLAPEEAGIYSAVGVLGKALMYLPSSFALAVFPMVSASDALNGDSFRILDKALLLTFALSAAALIAFSAAPSLVMGLLFGHRFSSGAPYLKYYGASMTLAALLSILISFNLARGKTAFIYSLVLGSALLTLAVRAYHADAREMLLTVLTVFSAVTAYNLVQVFRERQSYYGLRIYEFYKTSGAERTDRGV